ncbi:MAG: beta-ketoacyl-[acyl-carrier-protein] synthase family protein [Gemmataceae bacterium]|nr:beta-ketoacyl-[acyl-carrier-protein] synthase family protein [Gemmataceae bacterium]
MHQRRVVITGMGCISPLGHSVESLFRAACEGRSGVGPIRQFDARTFPTTFAAEVKQFDLSQHFPGADRYADCGVNTRFALAAARQALADANLIDNSKVDRDRFGIYLGSGEGIHDFPNLIAAIAASHRPDQRTLDATTFFRQSAGSFHVRRERELEMHTPPAHLAREFDLRGPNYNCLTACAASSQAIGEATAMIRYGDADLMLSGGSHSMIHPMGVTGFNLLTALSQNNANPAGASRPFDLNRDGFVLGEGSGMIVLEELEHARQRGATIYGEVSGYGTTGDAFRVTDSHEDGRGAISCIRMALADSGLPNDAVGYVNAHGTSTQVNDRTESLAIKTVFGERAYKIPVSATKSLVGHLIAAAGVTGVLMSIMTMLRGVAHPTINYETPDPECDLDYVPNKAREIHADHALTNAFGFGGQNISLILSKYKG